MLFLLPVIVIFCVPSCPKISIKSCSLIVSFTELIMFLNSSTSKYPLLSLSYILKSSLSLCSSLLIESEYDLRYFIKDLKSIRPSLFVSVNFVLKLELKERIKNLIIFCMYNALFHRLFPYSISYLIIDEIHRVLKIHLYYHRNTEMQIFRVLRN